MPRYWITPVFGEVPSYVVDNVSLFEAIENAFQAKLSSIARLHVQTFDDADFDSVYGRCIMYGVTGAIGEQDNVASIFCSATVITYSHDRDTQKLADVESVRQVLREAIIYEPEYTRNASD